MKFLIFLALILVLVNCQQKYEGCTGSENQQSLVPGNFKLVAQVPHGKKYTAPYDGRLFYILNLSGSAYEMGLAYGQLLKEEIPEMMKYMTEFAEFLLINNVSSVIPRLPKGIRNWLTSTAITIAQGLLSVNWYITQPYTNQRWNDEMRGIAEGSGYDIWGIRQLNMVPELGKASCSIFGAYGNASATNKLIHLRSLDWENHSKMSKFPLVTIYHSTEEGSIPFANMGWPVLIGSLTGYSAAKVGVGERLKGAPAYEESRFGTPWTYVLRDGLQFSKSESEYITFLQNAYRTCSIYLGVGGENFFNIVEYSKTYLNVYNWTNWKNDTYHSAQPDVLWKAYHDSTTCFNNIVKTYYGKIQPETIYRLMAPLGQTGDSQVAVMDYSTDIVYLMYPNPINFNPGYNSPPIQVDLKPFFTDSFK